MRTIAALWAMLKAEWRACREYDEQADRAWEQFFEDNQC